MRIRINLRKTQDPSRLEALWRTLTETPCSRIECRSSSRRYRCPGRTNGEGGFPCMGSLAGSWCLLLLLLLMHPESTLIASHVAYLGRWIQQPQCAKPPNLDGKAALLILYLPICQFCQPKKCLTQGFFADPNINRSLPGARPPLSISLDKLRWVPG